MDAYTSVILIRERKIAVIKEKIQGKKIREQDEMLREQEQSAQSEEWECEVNKITGDRTVSALALRSYTWHRCHFDPAMPPQFHLDGASDSEKAKRTQRRPNEEKRKTKRGLQPPQLCKTLISKAGCNAGNVQETKAQEAIPGNIQTFYQAAW